MNAKQLSHMIAPTINFNNAIWRVEGATISADSIDGEVCLKLDCRKIYPQTETDYSRFVMNIRDLVEAINRKPRPLIPEIKKVIFNNPATIVLWKDNTKTVVKSGEDETFDPEKGLAMAISKKALGNCGSYFDTFKKWTEPYYEDEADSIAETLTSWANAVFGSKE